MNPSANRVNAALLSTYECLNSKKFGYLQFHLRFDNVCNKLISKHFLEIGLGRNMQSRIIELCSSSVDDVCTNKIMIFPSKSRDKRRSIQQHYFKNEANLSCDRLYPFVNDHATYKVNNHMACDL